VLGEGSRTTFHSSDIPNASALLRYRADLGQRSRPSHRLPQEIVERASSRKRRLAPASCETIEQHGLRRSDPANGRKITFERWVPNTSASVWVLRIATRVATRLTRDVLGAEQPSWSPDRSRIVFVSATAKSGHEPVL